ncbi:MAG: hypothetical protein ACRCXC_03265 [Legionella sp.]
MNLISTIQLSSYLKLPSDFYEAIAPTPISTPYLVQFNHELASSLGISDDSTPLEKESIAFYAGNWLPEHLQSIALAYA